MARGTTSSIIKDSLPAGGIRTYVLWAEQGQVLLGHAIPWPERRNRVAQGRISLAVSRGSDWRSLTGPKRQESLWWSRLPSSGEYLLRVAVTGAPTAYTLSVRIPRRLVVNRERPVAALSGVAPPGALVDYLVKGAAGQNLDADLQGSGHGTHLHIYGLNDGIQLARLGERLQRFTGTLPSAQDYVISVAPAAEGTPYGLRVTVQ